MVKQNLSIGLKKGIKKSNKLYSQALKMIASGTNTFSRAPGVFPDGASPNQQQHPTAPGPPVPA